MTRQRVDILPPVLQPGDEPIRRRHSPPATRYEDFRTCLRWDFGFICAMCRLHETDFVHHGAAGSGLMWIEHLEPQSTTGKSKKHVYSNCYYTCRYCNHRRRAIPVRADGRSILDPCGVAWSAHFRLQDDRLVPLSADGEYTSWAYRLNDDRKRLLRRHRRERVSQLLETVEEAQSLLDGLVRKLATAEGSARRELAAQAKFIRKIWRQAEQELARWALAPVDRDERCACPSTRSSKKKASRRRVPKIYARQSISMTVDVGASP